MRDLQRTTLLQINGQPLPTPTASPSIAFTNITSSDSGRDEGGYYHQEIIRSGVLSCSLQYAYLSYSDAAYLLQLLSAASFTFTCPAPNSGAETQAITRTCYCKNLPTLSLLRSLTGLNTWKDVSIDIEEF